MSSPDGGGADPGALRVTERDACELGFSRAVPGEGPDFGPPCGEDPAAHCPEEAPTGAQPALLGATCAYGTGETECVPIFADCPWTRDATPAELYYTLANPNQPTTLGCWGGFEMAPYLGEDGTPHVNWRARGYDADCNPLPYVEGTIDLDFCCERILDIYYPGGDFTFRVPRRALEAGGVAFLVDLAARPMARASAGTSFVTVVPVRRRRPCRW
jgi:hypothetical protein